MEQIKPGYKMTEVGVIPDDWEAHLKIHRRNVEAHLKKMGYLWE